ncbi:APC family permease [Chroococcidiopsis sp. TS-821]|uniref:APC family permease n=1 Tax=Chroococcidiopsis sp. TS-821 TaxID=1378066 RepID=UPI000CEEB251|nr:amino acid permease [Chroococcidiopsis sp. TS-821]PPS44321.1 amino acid permease [Chroococcidiopsis sp. TS-821]
MGTVNTIKPTLLVWDAVALIVGVVIGAGIFETPALVAGNATNSTMVLLTWLLGGGVSIVGALCYAELATTYPHPGGNYYYLQRAFGNSVAFLFAWARLAVIQTGSIVLLAFVFGDYASQLWRLGTYSASIYAAVAIALLTGLNILGVRLGKWTQNWLAAAQVLGLLILIFFGLALATPATGATATAPTVTSSGNFGLAMVFVLLTYGGWNEAAFISAELHNVQKNMLRSLLWSIGIITAIYLLVNIAFLRGLGLAGMAESEALAAQLMRQAVGEPGAIFISLLVVVTTLCSTNATIFTGARTNYALGRDFSLFRFLGQWKTQGSTPATALLVQGAIALLLVLLGTITRNGFETMVDYTAPVFWFFFLLTGVSLFVLRRRDREIVRPFRVPLYPFIPLLFCVFCAYMLQSSLAYTGVGALVGVAVLLAGIPLLVITRMMRDSSIRRE